MRQGVRGRTVGIKVRLDDFSTHTRARTLRVSGQLDGPRSARRAGAVCASSRLPGRSAPRRQSRRPGIGACDRAPARARGLIVGSRRRSTRDELLSKGRRPGDGARYEQARCPAPARRGRRRRSAGRRPWGRPASGSALEQQVERTRTVAGVERLEGAAQLGRCWQPARMPSRPRSGSEPADRRPRSFPAPCRGSPAPPRNPRGGAASVPVGLRRPPASARARAHGAATARRPASTSTSASDGTKRVEEALDHLRRLGADELVDDGAVLEGLDRRNALDPERPRELRVRVGVDLHELDLAATVGDRSLEHGPELSARPAPFGPEVDHDRHLTRAVDVPQSRRLPR